MVREVSRGYGSPDPHGFRYECVTERVSSGGDVPDALLFLREGFPDLRPRTPLSFGGEEEWFVLLRVLPRPEVGFEVRIVGVGHWDFPVLAALALHGDLPVDGLLPDEVPDVQGAEFLRPEPGVQDERDDRPVALPVVPGCGVQQFLRLFVGEIFIGGSLLFRDFVDRRKPERFKRLREIPLGEPHVVQPAEERTHHADVDVRGGGFVGGGRLYV